MAALSAVVDGVRLGRGGALLLSGVIGAGKSALLDATANRADSLGLPVLRTTAAPDGAALPFDALTHLLLELPNPPRDELARAVQADSDDAVRYRLAMALVERLAEHPALVL